MTRLKSSRGSQHHLQLVRPPPPVPEVPKGTQLQLPIPHARFFVVDMSVATRHTFVTFLSEERPVFLFDIRPVPSFMLDFFSRKAAFLHFEQCNITYFDLGGILGIHSHTNASLTSGRVAEQISKIIADCRVSPDKLGILSEDPQIEVWLEHQLHEAIRPRPESGWKLEHIPKKPMYRFP